MTLSSPLRSPLQNLALRSPLVLVTSIIAPPAVPTYLLLEDDSSLLLEDGSKILLE